MKYKYFTYCPESGFDTHETLEGAINDANSIIPNYLDEGWSEDVTGVFVGTITHVATMCDKVERAGEVNEDGYDEDGEHWADPDWDYKCDYKMLPVSSEQQETDPVDLCQDSRNTIYQVAFEAGGTDEGNYILTHEDIGAIIDAAIAACCKKRGDL